VEPEKGRILLVEDNPSDVELILHEFRKAGIARYVQVLYDGAEALTYLMGSPGVRSPEIVILDLKLPKVDGLNVLHRIRNNPVTREIPVVVFTSSSEERDVQETRRCGVDLYIVKPVNHDEFIRAMERIVQFWQSLPKNGAAGVRPG
jgi:CheY-like chemotaxis protein